MLVSGISGLGRDRELERNKAVTKQLSLTYDRCFSEARLACQALFVLNTPLCI
jgi:hypothetical protein